MTDISVFIKSHLVQKGNKVTALKSRNFCISLHMQEHTVKVKTFMRSAGTVHSIFYI